jgi:hypothetical protein
MLSPGLIIYSHNCIISTTFIITVKAGWILYLPSPIPNSFSLMICQKWYEDREKDHSDILHRSWLITFLNSYFVNWNWPFLWIDSIDGPPPPFSIAVHFKVSTLWANDPGWIITKLQHTDIAIDWSRNGFVIKPSQQSTPWYVDTAKKIFLQFLNPELRDRFVPPMGIFLYIFFLKMNLRHRGTWNWGKATLDGIFTTPASWRFFYFSPKSIWLRFLLLVIKRCLFKL